jgi:AraC-like DNA-binding protein
MLLKNFLPSPLLREYVKSFGIVHLVFSDKEDIPIKSYVPKPENSIEFFLKDPEYVEYPGESKKKRSSAIILGQHTLVTNRYIGREFLYFKIGFQPGALYRLTGLPLYELTNTYVDAEAIFPKELRLLNEQLKNVGSYSQMISRAESFLLQRISKVKKDIHRIDISAKILLQNTEHVSLDWLSKEACLSSKQFERKFNERVGINPSLFERIIRFESDFRMKNNEPDKDWLSIALHCGYYDYQHLVRDYKAFTGQTPPLFSLLENQAPERIFGLRET